MAEEESSSDRSMPNPHFGEQGGRLSYGSYLHIPDLLQQQQLESDPPAHDELLFIIIHQTYELWFKQLLHELLSARDLMFAGETYLPRQRLHRVHVIERVLIEQIDILETMTPQDFLVFREKLAPASGFQSVQYRQLEFLSGAKDDRYFDRLDFASAEQRALLQRFFDEPSLWDGFLALLVAHGYDVSDELTRREALLSISRDRAGAGALWDVVEALLEHDAHSARWRQRHVVMVERQIGAKSGTGGSSGVQYLRSRTGMHYFPELWELRAYL